MSTSFSNLGWRGEVVLYAKPISSPIALAVPRTHQCDATTCRLEMVWVESLRIIEEPAYLRLVGLAHDSTSKKAR